MHVRESKARDFEDTLPKIFWSFAPERLKVEISAENFKSVSFGEGNAARGEDRGVMFGAKWKMLRDSTMLSSGQSKSLALEKSAKLGNIL